MSNVTNFVLMLQAKYRSCTELDHFVVQIHWNYFMRKQSSLFLIMPVLYGVTQSKVTSQNYNVPKTTLLELLLATLITLISEVLSYYMNSIGPQLKKDAITLQQ